MENERHEQCHDHNKRDFGLFRKRIQQNSKSDMYRGSHDRYLSFSLELDRVLHFDFSLIVTLSENRDNEFRQTLIKIARLSGEEHFYVEVSSEIVCRDRPSNYFIFWKWVGRGRSLLFADPMFSQNSCCPRKRKTK